MKKIEVLLVEDHVVLRDGIKALVADEDDIEIVGEAGNGREALECIPLLQPDVILMDLSMNGLNGIDATAQIQRDYPDVKVVILSMHDHEEHIFQALRAGAVGYVLKQSDSAELLIAIRAAVAGGSFLSPAISRTIIDDYIHRAEARGRTKDLDVLTLREREVLQLLTEAVPNREIAKKLGISVKTVESHRSNMMSKLDLKNKTELLRYALSKEWMISREQPL